MIIAVGMLVAKGTGKGKVGIIDAAALRLAGEKKAFIVELYRTTRAMGLSAQDVEITITETPAPVADPVPANRPASQPSLEDVIRERIEGRLHGRIRNLKVRAGTDFVVLEGQCSTYYTKQLAQHAAMGILEDEQLENAIVVRVEQ